MLFVLRNSLTSVFSPLHASLVSPPPIEKEFKKVSAYCLNCPLSGKKNVGGGGRREVQVTVQCGAVRLYARRGGGVAGWGGVGRATKTKYRSRLLNLEMARSFNSACSGLQPAACSSPCSRYASCVPVPRRVHRYLLGNREGRGLQNLRLSCPVAQENTEEN